LKTESRKVKPTVLVASTTDTMMKKGSGVQISKMADHGASDHHTAPPANFEI
jgi:hypothetical protein